MTELKNTKNRDLGHDQFDQLHDYVFLIFFPLSLTESFGSSWDAKLAGQSVQQPQPFYI